MESARKNSIYTLQKSGTLQHVLSAYTTTSTTPSSERCSTYSRKAGNNTDQQNHPLTMCVKERQAAQKDNMNSQRSCTLEDNSLPKKEVNIPLCIQATLRPDKVYISED